MFYTGHLLRTLVLVAPILFVVFVREKMEPSQPRGIGAVVEDWLASQVVLRVRELISQQNLNTFLFQGDLSSLYVGTGTSGESLDPAEINVAPILIDDGGTEGRVNIVVRNPSAGGRDATKAVSDILRQFDIDPDRAARGTGSDAQRRIFSLYRR